MATSKRRLKAARHAGLVVARVRDPCLHDPRRIGQAAPFLDADAVVRVGVVAGPHLVDASQDAEVDTTAAARAAFDLQMRECCGAAGP